MLKYILKESKNKEEKSPLIIMIHGFGADEYDLFGIADFLPDNYTVISVQGQFQMDMGFGRHWYNIFWDGESKTVDLDQALDSKSKLIELIKTIPNQLNIDSSDITLFGFSQGSILSHSIALSHPELIKNVIACSGYIDKRLVELSDNKDLLKQLNVFMSHGKLDEVISVHQAQEADSYLNELEIEHFYKEYTMAHSISEESLKDLLGWLNGI